MLTRNDVLEKALNDCLSEMYKKAQPPLNWNKLYNNAKKGIEPEDKEFVYHHYLSQAESESIIDEFIHAYKMQNVWETNVTTVYKYLNEGGTKDKYIPERVDENGFKHPGYRGYENTPKLADVIGEEYAKVALDLITLCKEFYRGDLEESRFKFSVYAYSPSCCKHTVQEYWDDKDVTIYDVELDPETEIFVKVTPSQIKQWKKALKLASDDEYLRNAYVKLLKKYEKEDNINS